MLIQNLTVHCQLYAKHLRVPGLAESNFSFAMILTSCWAAFIFAKSNNFLCAAGEKKLGWLGARLTLGYGFSPFLDFDSYLP